jgi:hypothetical protein
VPVDPGAGLMYLAPKFSSLHGSFAAKSAKKIDSGPNLFYIPASFPGLKVSPRKKEYND